MVGKILLVLAVLVIVLAAGAFLFINPGAMPNYQPSVQPSSYPSPTGVYASATAQSSPNSDQLEQEWASINNPNVERACLVQAKREASARGYSEQLVISCGCSPHESPESKSYDCKVSALDGSHPASVLCTKSLRECQITSEFGTVRYTFDQLRVMFGS